MSLGRVRYTVCYKFIIRIPLIMYTSERWHFCYKRRAIRPCHGCPARDDHVTFRCAMCQTYRTRLGVAGVLCNDPQFCLAVVVLSEIDIVHTTHSW